jgi:hypothetical protein
MSCSKQPYRTQWMALCAMRAIIRKRQGQDVKVPTGAYLCSECRRWHLTSKSGSQMPPWGKGRAKR